MVTNDINRIIGEALKELGVKRPQVVLEHPGDLSHGDYSTNVALVYGKKLEMSPLEVARAIVAAFNKQPIAGLEKVEIAGFGFINFYLAPSFFGDSLEMIGKNGASYGANNNLKNKKVIVEYTDPNPFKEFHLGHLMSNIIGESISRVIGYSGAELHRACYQGDVGLHIAKAVYGLQHQKFDFWKVKLLGDETTRANFLGRAYSFGAKEYESNPEVKQLIIELNKEIYLRNNNSTNYYYDTGKNWSLDYFNSIYKILGTKFDHFFFESATGDFGQKIVMDSLKKDIFKQSDGAIIFPGEDFGLHTRVFINSEGLPTYEAKELGLAHIKYEDYPYDLSVVITGNEVNDYFKVVLKAMELVFPQLAEKTVHLSHGMLRLPSGKMSSRTGDVITAVSIIEDIKKMVADKIKDRDYDQATKAQVVEAVAVGAIKFSILRQAPGKDVIFDFDKSISFEGDSGPYLQYAYTRAKSILDKANKAGIEKTTKKTVEEIYVLEKLLYRFPEVVERAGKEFSPHYIVTYLLELAASFNNFYAQNKIVDANDLESGYKVALTESFSIVMKNGLYLLGIVAPDKM
ncbi:MAG: arginine--tRNA ligase [Candidatus Vogelbacteria bacterium]|nr:arginine--tRNA ligase [Candidatus Vogelbacteria bacterium]